MKKHYHLIGIGGIGMGTLATLLLAKGHKVSGSDLKENELTAKLKKDGALIMIGHHASNVQSPDYVVHSSAIRMNNPEMIESVSRQLPLLKRAELLAQLVNEQTAITIAGAHGKTTTTSMISSLLINAQLKPTTAVGGIINNGGVSYNAFLGEGKYFVAEVDESDGTFLYFNPHLSVITNIDYEHVDFYKDWEGILSAYRKFIDLTVAGGTVVACGEDEKLKALVLNAKANAVLYGFSPQFDVHAANIMTDGFSTTFSCFTREGKVGDFKLSVPGRHNVLNALACIAIGLRLGIDTAVIDKTLREFSGVKRRFQLKGKVNEVMVVDDYGHHPSEITATLSAARLFKGRRLITVFQPHRYSRTKFLLDEFVQSLQNTDKLVLTDIYAASEKPSEGVNTSVLVDKVKEAMGEKSIYLKKEHILDYLLETVGGDDLVLFLGAGDVYHLSDELVKGLQAKAEASSAAGRN